MSNKAMVSTETENKAQRKVFLPNKLLECLPRSSSLPNERLRWNTNEEIASYLVSFDRHDEWLSCTLKTRPKNGSIILYNRKKVKYRKDGYCWKKRKDGKDTREDHMKLKVQGMECLYGNYVHSSIVPTFHRRCYWLLQNPDIVLVHYLNVPSLEDSGKSSPLLCASRHDGVRWSRDDLLNQLKPMFHSMKCSLDSGDFSIEELVQNILDRQRTKPQPRTHTCLCNTAQVTSGMNIPHRCNSTKHRIISPKLPISPCIPPTTPRCSEVGDAGGGGVEAKLPHFKAQCSPSSSPCPSSTAASSPPQPHRAAITLANHGNGFYSKHSGNLATVALPQNAVIVMATTSTLPQGGGRQGGVGVANHEHAGPRRSLSLGHSRQMLLSPALPTAEPTTAVKPASSPPPPSSSPQSFPPTAPTPGVTTVSLTLLSSPVIGSLLLTPTPSTPLCSHPPPPTAVSPPSPSSSPSPPLSSSSVTPPFDPDSFLNSPKQGQTYGGPILTSSSSPSPTLCSPSTHCSPSLPLSLSDTSVATSSVSPPSSLSSLSSSSCEAERRNSSSSSSSSSPPLPSLPPTHGLPLSPTSSVTPHLVPLCLELEALGELDGASDTPGDGEELKDRPDNEDDDDEGSAPPTKLALLQSNDNASQPSSRQQTGSHPNPLLLTCQDSNQPSQQITETQQHHSDEDLPILLGPSYSLMSAPEAPASSALSHSPLIMSPNQSFSKSNMTSLSLENPDTNPGHFAVPIATTDPAVPLIQVKEEGGRSFDNDDTAMDTHLEAEPCDRGGDELEISFDSQFPDLISDLMTEDVNTVVAPPPAPNPTVFPAGIRYMVPPQPLPSSSFLPFPHPTTASSSSSRLATITDFSPEWSYPEGGVKVLITGPWSELFGRYSCVFDQSTVPASLIQPGVLRCYCPAHEAGLVCLQVLESGTSISSSVLFEYRARNASSLPSSQLDWLSLDDNQFRMSILERLEQMERRMAEMAARGDNHQQQHSYPHHGNQLATPPPPPLPDDQAQSSQWFERRIVGVCERMMRGGRWSGGGEERLHHSVRHRGMTLLHLAAAQGYTHLIHTLIHWRRLSSDSLDLEQEVDPLNVDHFSCTPLMWACALGHQSAAELLYSWNSLALGIPDSLGRLPLAVARSRGHTRLATALEELHTQTHMMSRDTGSPPSDTTTPVTPQPQLPLSPLSTSPDTGLSSSSSLLSPSDPSSPSPSSAYSSGPAPMDTSPSSPSSPSSSSSSLPVSPPSPSSLPMSSMWGEESNSGLSAGLNPGASRDSHLYLMDYENTCPSSSSHLSGGRRSHVAATLEEQLLSYSENAENEDEYLEEEVLQVDMATLAEQIIEATPDRIKQENFSRGAESPLRERRDNPAIHDPWLATYLDTVDTHTQSPPRRLCPPSPLSALALQRLRPPSSAAWAEFLNASANGKMERDFALLTLTDGEQRELYEAARIIQNAFRRYKGRRLKEQQDMAAAVIQRCYRKYKQLTWIALKYALYKKMTQAAILIQSKFRSYYEQKRFQQSRRAAVLIQQYYRSYKEYERLKQTPRAAATHNPKIKGSFLTKKQDQAARKIMRFLRRCRHRIKELKQMKELERRGLTT
ncbi:calmodulin-binding transcription activator 2 isoform X1 [Synchiropus splendidus]|uniref:calmodulin-binding transcription activator 2 isoform X1 n=1 Tax=Synchiropus splendidus TaxID=270530 RepID=UPI00237E246B|nr:calmodulin-binding transcription activator 2 isoform X1 [Synchiropus splendidus]